MFQAYARWPIARQITVVAALLVLIAFVGVALGLSRINATKVIEDTDEELVMDANLMVKVLESFFENVKARGERESKTLHQTMGGDLSVGTARVRTGEVDLPELRAGKEVLNANRRVLIEFKGLTGTEAAFLAVDNGKVYRAATLLQKNDEYMDGTPVADGDPVTKAVLAGQDYSGLTVRQGRYYLSVVKVIKDVAGKPVAATSVRVPLDSELAQIRNVFSEMKTGDTGYVYIVRPTGDDKIGEFVAHPAWAGKTVVDAIDNEVARDEVRNLIAQGKGVMTYDLPNAEGRMAQKTVGMATAPSWKWVVVFGTWTDEYLGEVAHTRRVLIIVGVAAAALVAVLLWLLVRSRLDGLSPAVGAIRALGDGDLRVSLPDSGDTRNEIGLLATAVNDAVARMRELVSGVGATARKLADDAAGVEDHSRAVAGGAAEQANAASSMAAAVEELSVSISHVADSAAQSADASTQACDATVDGRGVVRGTIDEMHQIAGDIAQSAGTVESLVEQSRQISGVVQVIRDIADQTNLLALNAAIEAARAGEQGRGFAVVADEVRKLAERTAQSTQEIADTISAIVAATHGAVGQMHAVRERVDKGVALAEQTGTALEGIDQRARHSLGIANDIASGTREQSAASQELARTVERVAQGAEDASRSAGENLAAANDLRALAIQLQGALERFKL